MPTSPFDFAEDIAPLRGSFFGRAADGTPRRDSERRQLIAEYNSQVQPYDDRRSALLQEAMKSRVDVLQFENLRENLRLSRLATKRENETTKALAKMTSELDAAKDIPDPYDKAKHVETVGSRYAHLARDGRVQALLSGARASASIDLAKREKEEGVAEKSAELKRREQAARDQFRYQLAADAADIPVKDTKDVDVMEKILTAKDEAAMVRAYRLVAEGKAKQAARVAEARGDIDRAGKRYELVKSFGDYLVEIAPDASGGSTSEELPPLKSGDRDYIIENLRTILGAGEGVEKLRDVDLYRTALRLTQETLNDATRNNPYAKAFD